jgi:uridine kinase
VAIDGVDGAGKTIFADHLAEALGAAGRTVVRVSIDGFHNPRQVRYRRGRSSPEGYWRDSYDYERFRAEVLTAFSPGGDRRYRRAIRDVRTDDELDVPYQQATQAAVLLVDGIFLHRDELVASWDFSIFLRVPFEVTVARMAVRDGMPGNPAAPENRRYVVGQQLYLDSCDPARRATVVIDNTDPEAPRIV